MENQALFSSKDKRKKIKSRLLQFLFGALWVNNFNKNNAHQNDEKDFTKNLHATNFGVSHLNIDNSDVI